ncbi:SIS domain-containing protein [Halovulum sp. GXIMD14793]
MTTITEDVIRDQFPYLTKAIKQPLPTLGGDVLVFVGCGTSYYLAQTLACAANAAGKQAVAVPGAEWARRADRYIADRAGCRVIGLSRSGTTTETVQAIEEARGQGLPTTAISCEKNSKILQTAETGIYLPTDAREGIVMTTSASLMLLGGLRMLGAAVTDDLIMAAANALAAVDENGPSLLKGRSHFVYLGAGENYGIANEAALKLQEMSISYSQAFHPMEYRHGPISLIDDASVVVVLYHPDTTAEEAEVTRDVQAKGALVIGVGGPGDLQIDMPIADGARTLAMLPALQLLGEKVALQKNINTETPRHLTKVVVLQEGSS